MPNTEILPFTFEGVEVRTLTIDDAPWFVVADIARVLQLSNPSVAASSVDMDDLSTAEVIDSLGRTQTAHVVNESGMYQLIFQSRKAEAHAFKRWVTSEVLPQIRRTGSYTAPGTELALDTNAIKQLHAAVTVLLEANERQAVEVAELTPRADAWDAIASADGDYSVGEAAKMLSHAGIPNMGPQRLFSRLEDIGWTFRAGGVWQAKADRVEKGFLSIKPQFHYHPGTGQRVVDPPQVRVTLKGVEQLRKRLGGGTGAIQAVAS